MKTWYLLILFLLSVIIYWLNESSNGTLEKYFYKLPKILAIIIAFLGIFFPNSLADLPEFVHSINKRKILNQKILNQKTPDNNRNIFNNNRKIKRNVNQSLKKYIAASQEWKCNMCQNLLDATYEVDHITPLYKGGSNEHFNLQALCRNCHGKTQRRPPLNNRFLTSTCFQPYRC